MTAEISSALRAPVSRFVLEVAHRAKDSEVTWRDSTAVGWVLAHAAATGLTSSGVADEPQGEDGNANDDLQ